jgi:hypothetical protein
MNNMCKVEQYSALDLLWLEEKPNPASSEY